MKSPYEYYLQKHTEQTAELKRLRKKVSILSWLRILVAVSVIVVIYLSFTNIQSWQFIALAIGSLTFLYLMRRHAAASEMEIRTNISLHILQAEIRSLENDYSSFLTGKEYIDTSHPYAFDLDIFGHKSIYQLLCRSVTKDGAHRLATLLKHPYADEQVITERQTIIKELSTNPELLHDFRVAGARYEEASGDSEKVLKWLTSKDKFIQKKYLIVIAVLVPLCTVFFGALSVVEGSFHQGLLYIIILNWLVLMLHNKDIKDTHMHVARSAKLIDKFEHLLVVIASSSFNTPMLKNINRQALASVKQIAAFRKLVHMFDSRQNGMVGPLMNSFFLFDIYCVLRLEFWRKKHRFLLQESFDHITALDVYVSLATYAFNNPGNIYAQVTENVNTIVGSGVKHPLLDAKTAVGNDFELGENEQLYLLTGANMTGKSTFIRTVGVNIILAYIGIPVRADVFKVPMLHLFTAIRISDSVQDDISYFKAELNRMQQLMQQVAYGSCTHLVLLDEPLRGTNSTDKQAGTRSIIERLLKLSALGIVATHDTALCNLEVNYPSKVSNYHFESEVTDNGLNFDFKLKQGCSTSNNATALMKLMNIID